MRGESLSWPGFVAHEHILQRRLFQLDIAHLPAALGEPGQQAHLVAAVFRLGDEGQGFALCERLLVEARVPYAAGCIGIAQEALEIAIDWARDRRAFGSTLSEKQSIQWMIADSNMELRAARLLTQDAARKCDAGLPFKVEASIAKVVATETAGRVVDRCLQILGGMGVAKEMPLERWYRELRIKRIGEGPSEVHRMVLARQLFKGTA